jgi:DNA-binding response OmpR family regulator
MATKKVLLINDDETTLNTYSYLLSEEGYFVVTAKSGIRALKAFYHHSFDLVITDLAMNNGGGFTILGVIKVLSPNTPLIVFLNKKSEVARKSVSLLRTCILIEKPCNYEIFLSFIRSPLDTNKREASKRCDGQGMKGRKYQNQVNETCERL